MERSGNKRVESRALPKLLENTVLVNVMAVFDAELIPPPCKEAVLLVICVSVAVITATGEIGGRLRTASTCIHLSVSHMLLTLMMRRLR